MNNKDTGLHVQGQSVFTGDLNLPEHSLFAAVFTAPYAHGKITQIDYRDAEKMDGVVRVLTARDIPGINQIGNVVADEPLLAEEEFTYIGQPIALVLAESHKIAQKALAQIQISYEKLPVITDPREAYQKGNIIGEERVFSCGDILAQNECAFLFEGRVDSGAQEHLYLETQVAIAIPVEKGKIKIVCSSQSPTAVQHAVAVVLGLSENCVESEVLRLGGGFGGKESQASTWAALAALGAFRTNRAVKLTLPRKTDLIVTGKRHPYSSDFRIGLDKNLKIIYFEVMYYQNAGAYTDLSGSVLERTLFHATNSYFIPNVKVKAVSCRTNLAPNTAFRGFGGPQAMFVIESAIYEAARQLQAPAYRIQQANIIAAGQRFPYGMKMQENNAKACFDETLRKYDFEKKLQEAKGFNAQNKFLKKGISVMPVCFGISFTTTFLNQASSLVHIYTDGSIGISTGAVEMGQGVNEKIRKIAALTLGVSVDRIRTETTNTTRIANISPTAASTGTDLNGNATLLACQEIKNRLLCFLPTFTGQGSESDYAIVEEQVLYQKQAIGLDWNQLVINAYLSRISLSSHAFYATPGISFDLKSEKESPFAYHVCGTAIIQVTADCQKGTYVIDSVEVIHDTGASIDPTIDMGQMEGGIVQGIGWITMEEVLHSKDGRLITNTLSTYKIPDILFSPKKISVHFLEAFDPSKGVLGAKATGEPPLMYGIGVYFALLNAARAFRPELIVPYSAPMTHEKFLMMLYDNPSCVSNVG